MNLSFGRRTTLRGLLLWWIVGGALALVLVYAAALEYYFRLGIDLRTRAGLEDYAIGYAARYAQDPETPLPTGKGVRSYRSLLDLPVGVQQAFGTGSQAHNSLRGASVRELKHEDDIDRDALELDCDGQDCDFIFLYSYMIDDDEWLYITQNLAVSRELAREQDWFEGGVNALSVLTVVLFVALAFFLFRRIDVPVQALARWADTQTLEEITGSQPPDFRYRELNSVALRLQAALENMAEGLRKEQRFLQHASHELRTPIAVAAGNLELLKKLSEGSERPEQERQVLQRLENAVTDMKQMTETLLWLNRDGETVPAAESVDLHALVRDIVDTNRYLLEYKEVEVSVEGDRYVIETPLVLIQIVLSNLVRNAFQYTDEGDVILTIGEDGVEIANTAWRAEDAALSSDYGFGLGLDLVSQIAGRMGWTFGYHTREGLRISCLRLDGTTLADSPHDVS